MALTYASVCSYVRIRSQTPIYGMGTLGIRRIRSSYADIRLCTLCYTQISNDFWTCSKFISVCERIDDTVLIRLLYARHSLDTLDIRLIRKRYAIHTFVKSCSWEAGLTVVRIRRFFSEICIRNAYAIVWLHLQKQRNNSYMMRKITPTEYHVKF